MTVEFQHQGSMQMKHGPQIGSLKGVNISSYICLHVITLNYGIYHTQLFKTVVVQNNRNYGTRGRSSVTQFTIPTSQVL